ncbi:coiled-coil domain-containing protein 28B-like isoform X1 [Acyrthosiphon pisum]|uniref:ACYPI000161 protein n=1 Tax=Acyrthosiphon pisum TaxID=7029 RepID=C4WX81_ACYPI|nr:coiled-coil domain-containing protein 28B-like [Acyrthosiphon pisum]XP_008180431.1 coiled-coil domain-containing protein 28B-like isoform X1 [Acyrthosiphon pisum]BAH72501.1 ACYPI000161 [Acyrthosiphon pisum]|eukprot:NP_001155368.1 coiled-coil domain-containing protein 28B-like [Acyrthosiphon pisum]
MSIEKEECELEQLVSSDEEPRPTDIAQITPPITPKPPPRAHSHSDSRTKTSNSLSIESQKNECHKSTARLSSASSIHQDKPQTQPSKDVSGPTRLMCVNERVGRSSLHDYKPPRPPPPNFSKLQNKKVLSEQTMDRSCLHHCFLSDVTDVRQMEQALQQLLEDFHSGKLRAFGKDCSMEQMTAIREQQEHLAWLHFELGVRQDGSNPLSEQGIAKGTENMHSLMASLEQLSLSIEKLHSFSNSTSD